ncbi:Collagen alpha-1(X) chain Precursor [Channa argus]|uniref:Collagen alpha-1(X) chain n=1 Tax=Channa argus TaxID=215402 RepID=A0A6G1Q5N2_CHAAH|nr:Collagen alpha-1(X) chain Precursor [Channa argus]
MEENMSVKCSGMPAEKKMVAFTAAINTCGAHGPFNIDTTVIFNSVITNIGEAYNQSTGIFVAPVAGVYYFIFFYHAGGEHASRLSLYKNGNLMVESSDHKTNADGADNGGNAVLLQLNKGDQVYVRLAANYHIWATSAITTFSGFLVSPM